jgi:hypothetical protein
MSNSYKRDPLIFGSGFHDPNLEWPELPVEINLLYEAFVKEGMRKKDIYEKPTGYKRIEPDSIKRELMRRRKNSKANKSDN